ncbi:MAG: ABC-2 family transporter protein [Clostridia bacterium]|nr:ABC-2 family transporter protein [Clostridia bacterium]
MRLYFKFVLMFIKSEMEYKLAFFLSMVASTLGTLVTVLGIVFLLQKFGSVGGWKIEEVMLITGIAIFGYTCVEIFLRGLDMLYTRVKSGILDQMMTRPRKILFQVACSDFQMHKIGRLLESIILIIYGLINVNVEWNIYKVFVFVLVLIASNIVFAALQILKAAFCFWTIDGMELMNILQDGGRDLSSYPLSIYKEWFAKFFTYIIPFGLCTYYPIMYLLGKDDAPFWYGLTPILVIPFMLAMLGVWNIGLRNYKSTGS